MSEPLYETRTFIHADRRIRQLLETMKSKGACGCCVARAMSFNAVAVAEDVMGSAEGSPAAPATKVAAAPYRLGAFRFCAA
jgi:hypothetical protein